LADLLRQVHSGQGFTITQRGEPVADLVPAGTTALRTGVAAALQLKSFMAETPTNVTCDIDALLNDGRD